MDGLFDLKTESNNQASVNIDCMSPLEIAQLMNQEDARCISAVEKETEQIAKGISLIECAFRKGGRLLYFGCGTSGRLGVLDASECPPTFGTPPEMVLGIIAGGDTALRHAVENAEDDAADGEVQAAALQVGSSDVVVGISASGRSPFVLGAMRGARRAGAATIGLSNNHHCEMEAVADVLIAPEVGPEVVQGSTRLKAGTAQKMVLNMLSTGAMIRIGKVYRNMMVDMVPTNQKLHIRAVRLVQQSTDCTEQEALQALEGCGYHVKTAIIMILTGQNAQESRELLRASGGYVRRALEQEGVSSTGL